MLTKLNNAFSEWDGFDMWHKLTFGITIVSFAIPVVCGSWIYWSEMLSHIPENASFFAEIMMLGTFSLAYVIVLGFLAWAWVYMSFAIGFAISTLALPFIWLYRKICP
ncbi:hypothetical protein [Mannheimia pernigra]|uniref:hypothetical protein n=1 Tax=Mannheimia pernigra TaxID=111844 RepID=UPI00159F3DC8|nr:hypothetical protein [Mannheimia pernigra]QLB43536.1 hypothetical protein HV561_01490 [Mannheimia pernigra]